MPFFDRQESVDPRLQSNTHSYQSFTVSNENKILDNAGLLFWMESAMDRPSELGNEDGGVVSNF